MATDIKIEDNSKQVIEELERLMQIALEECGFAAEGFAKRLCPVDTGLLRNSITHTTDENSTYVGTNVEYAPYVELGTTKMAARPFIKPAVTDHQSEYQKIIEARLKD